MNGPVIRSRAPIGQPQQPQQGIQPRAGIQPTHIGAPQPQQRGIAPQQAPRQPAGLQGYAHIKEQQNREAAEAARKAQERQDGYMPQEFYLASPDKRGVRQDELCANIVILDVEPSFAIHEHNFPDPKTGKMGKGSFRTICLAGEGPCPACEADQKEAYFALKLTVMDLRPYTNNQNVLVPHSRKLLTVKQKNQPYFFRMYERHGTLRGMQLFMIRDDPRGASHGNPEFVALHPEDLIMQSFQHPQVMSRGGNGQPPRLLKEANADCFAFDYAKLYPRLSYEELAAKVGLAPAGGGYGQQVGYGGGYDANQTWGADAGQFHGIQPQRIGMQGGIQPRGLIGGGQINNQMQGDGYNEDDQYDDPNGQDQQYDQGQQGYQQGVTSNGQTFDLDDEIPFDGGVSEEPYGYADQGQQGVAPSQEAAIAPQTRQPAQPQIAPRPNIAQRAAPPQRAQQSQRPAGAGVTDPNHIPL